MVRPILNKVNTLDTKQLWLALLLSYLAIPVISVLCVYGTQFLEYSMSSDPYPQKSSMPFLFNVFDSILQSFVTPFLFLLPSIYFSYKLIKPSQDMAKLLAKVNLIGLLLITPIFFWLFWGGGIILSSGVDCALFNKCLITVD